MSVKLVTLQLVLKELEDLKDEFERAGCVDYGSREYYERYAAKVDAIEEAIDRLKARLTQ